MIDSRLTAGTRVSSLAAASVLTLAAGVALAACGGDDEETTTPATATTVAEGTTGAEIPEEATDAFVQNCEESARRSAPPGTDADEITSYCECTLEELSGDLSLEMISELGQEAAETGVVPGRFERAAEECRSELE